MIALKVEMIGDQIAVILTEEALDVLNAKVGGVLHLEPTREVLRQHGGLWFYDESYVISRRRH